MKPVGISPRNRRLVARWLRRTGTHAHEPHPLARRRETLLHYRVAAVRTDLLAIAALLEHAHAPDPACVAELHDLLANGCDSPLYNPDIHISELQATLYYVRTGLASIATLDPHPMRDRLSNRSSTIADSASQANASRTPCGSGHHRDS